MSLDFKFQLNRFIKIVGIINCRRLYHNTVIEILVIILDLWEYMHKHVHMFLNILIFKIFINNLLCIYSVLQVLYRYEQYRSCSYRANFGFTQQQSQKNDIHTCRQFIKSLFWAQGTSKRLLPLKTDVGSFLRSVGYTF